MDPVCHLPMESAELYSRAAGAGAPDGKPNLRFQKPSRVSVFPSSAAAGQARSDVSWMVIGIHLIHRRAFYPR